jgi:hypothetical protein
MIVQQGLNTFWLTTEVTEIEIDTPEYVRFRTKNSSYEWTILPDQNSPAPSEPMTESETKDDQSTK